MCFSNIYYVYNAKNFVSFRDIYVTVNFNAYVTKEDTK